MKNISQIFIYLSLILLTQLVYSSCGHSAKEWRSKSIYQIITDRWARDEWNHSECKLKNYCGGNWLSIIDHLDYIKNMGFDAIWISPIVENTEHAYHGYNFKNIEKVNPYFGTEEDLKKLVSECHKKDIWVMVDVVANHCGFVPEGDYSSIHPFNSPEHYHSKCEITDWDDQDIVENCRLSDLPDLKQENPWVEQKLLDWVKNIVKKYDFDGIRIDTVLHVPKWFWKKFNKAAGVYALGEVFNGKSDYVSKYQDDCLDGVFNYPLFYAIKEAFCFADNAGDFSKLQYYYNESRNKFRDPSLLGVFVDNHDNPRFLSWCRDQNIAKYSFKNAIVFSMTWEGIPVLYYGSEQYFSGSDDPYNREPFWGHYNEQSDLYIMIKKINELRKSIYFYNADVVQRYADKWFYSFSRNEMFVALNQGTPSFKYIKTQYHPYKEGDVICNLFDVTECITVEKDGFGIDMTGDPKIFVKWTTLKFMSKV